jgi:ABC-type transporter Mla MlaB component
MAGKEKMLRITIQDKGDRRRLELAGKLAGEWVAETEKAFKAEAASKETEVDLTAVTRVDEAGCRLLRAMVQAGATLIAKGVAMTALVDEIRCPAPGTHALKSNKTGDTENVAVH